MSATIPSNSGPEKSNLIPLSFQGSDADLASAIIRGDRRAMGALVDRHGRYVERLVAHLIGMDPALYDLVQEIFTRAITDIHSLRQPDRLKPWLRAVAVNTVRSELKRRTRWSWFRFSDPAELPDLPAPEADDVDTDNLTRVREILDRMPVDERLILSLRYFEEMEQTEIGREMGISLATVKRRLNRATERFQMFAQRDPSLAPWLEDHREKKT
jgi:RNA polymerase sigma-70 factor, ECF subfamily